MQLTPEEEFRLYGCLVVHAEEALDALAELNAAKDKAESIKHKVDELVEILNDNDSPTATAAT